MSIGDEELNEGVLTSEKQNSRGQKFAEFLKSLAKRRIKEVKVPTPELTIEQVSAFPKLREQLYIQLQQETQDRIKTNPTPTEEELRAGAFREEVEPQVRDAVFKLREKGYQTRSSGFYGEHAQYQGIDGEDYPKIDNETAEALTQIGVDYKAGISGNVGFYPENANVGEITQKWNKVADILPDLGKPARESLTAGAYDFRQNPLRDRLELRSGGPFH